MSDEVRFIKNDNEEKNSSNDNKKEIEEIKSKGNAIFTALIYALVQFIFSGVLVIILVNIYSRTHSEVEYDILIKAMSENDFTEYADIYKEASAILLSYTNFISYLIILVAVIILCKDVFINNFNDLLKKPLFYAIFIPAAAIVFYAISALTDYLVSQFAPSNANQTTIELMIQSEAGWMIMIMVIIMAPIIEEIVYRYVVFKLTKKVSLVLSYILSIILFTLPHVVSTNISDVGFGIWLLQCIPYLVSAGLFALIYHKSNYNIYASITAHMLNNAIAVLLVLVH